MADLDDIVEYYVNLLIIQYHDQPKAQVTIRLFAKAFVDAAGIFMDIRDGYDVDSAVGVQLDVLGKYIGVDRHYSGQNLTGFFAFTNYAETAIPANKRGFDREAAFPSGKGKWLTYASVLGVGLTLDDDNYRVILKLKIVQNNSNHSAKSIDDGLYEFFGSGVRLDESPGGMLINYFVPGNYSEIIRVAIQKAVLPKPMGVRLGYYIPQNKPFFAFVTYANIGTIPQGVTGFSNYADFSTVPGETLDYDKLLTGA